MDEPLQQARDLIFSRKDVPVRVRSCAWWLYGHELEKAPHLGESVLAAVLRWMDEQRLLEARRRLEPNPLELRLLRLLICDGLTIKQIALQTGRRTGTMRLRFKRMRERLGDLTMYQLVALSVERGWVKMNNE